MLQVVLVFVDSDAMALDLMHEEHGPGLPIDGSRFLAHSYRYTAIKIATRKRRKTGLAFHVVRLPITIGEGYLKGGEIYRRTKTAIVAWDDEGRLRAAHPDLRAEDRSQAYEPEFLALGELLVSLVAGADDDLQVKAYARLPDDDERAWVAALTTDIRSAVERIEPGTLSRACAALDRCVADPQVAEDTRCSMLLPLSPPHDDACVAFQRVQSAVTELTSGA